MMSEIKNKIAAADNFLIAAHSQPDGDALGSMLGLGYLLDALGKESVIALVPGDVPEKYRFLPGIEKGSNLLGDSLKDRTLTAVDVANKSRLGPLNDGLSLAKLTINIDHHPDNDMFADFNWVDDTASSTSEMIYDLWGAFEKEPSVEAAICLYVGMVTDTGRWQYSNTGAKALRVAAELIDLGVRPNDIYNQIFQRNTQAWAKLMAHVLLGAVTVEDIGLTFGVINQVDLISTGAKMSELENVVDWLRSIEGTEVAIVIKEMKSGEYKMSARSRGEVDVGALARTFGGGGHRNAAGFAAKGSPSVITADIKKWLRKRDN